MTFDALDQEPNSLWRDLDEIEAFGFSIERHPILGIACLGTTERLCPDQIEFGLGQNLVGRRVSVWDKVGSTNDIAAKAGASTANEGLVVLAEEQTAGRGSRGRPWSASPRSAVLMSILLFPEGPLAMPSWLTALGAVAVAEVVARLTGREAQIKWPNDVRVGKRKIAGILVERRAGAGVVIGIGLNANLAINDFPESLRETATSLRILVGEPVDRSEVARNLIQALDFLYKTSRDYGPDQLNARWRERIEHIGQNVVVVTPSATLTGLVKDLELNSGLALTDHSARRIVIPPHEILSISAEIDRQ